MRASSSRATSASRSSARRCFGSRSASATSTRASRSVSSSCRQPTATGWRGASRAIRQWPTHGPTAWRWNPSPGVTVPPRARWIRALMLERERVANHLGDLGALGNDAALGFGLAQFMRLKEDWLRVSNEAFGHRLMMDCIVPGGVAADLDAIRGAPPARGLRPHRRRGAHAPRHLRRARGATGPVHDHRAGRLGKLAVRLGLCGLAAPRERHRRRSPRAIIRRFRMMRSRCAMATQQGGDVAARVAVRFEETLESLRLIRALCDGLPAGDVRRELGLPASPALGAGWIEGWRGEVLVALEVRCRRRDPALPLPRSVLAELAVAGARRASATSFPTSRSSTSPSI